MNFLHMLLQAATHPNVPQGMQHAGGPVAQPMQYAQPKQPMAVNGQVDPASQAMYQQAMNSYQQHTSPLHQLVHGSMGPQYGQGSNFSTPVQGMQNPGFTPMQGSQGVRPIQGNIQF